MASLSYDQRRGMYRVWYRTLLGRASKTVGKLPAGTPRPKRDPADVLARYAEIEENEAKGTTDGSLPAVPLAEFFAAHREHLRLTHRRSTIENHGQAENRFARLTGERYRFVSEVDDEAARAFVKAGVQKLSRGTITTTLGYLSTAWQWAIEMKWASDNPWMISGSVPSYGEETLRLSWSPAEYEALVLGARHWLRDVLVVGCHTGLRVGELCAIEWSWVREEGRTVVRVPAVIAKNGKERRIPLPAAAKATLVRCREMRPGPGPLLRGHTGVPLDRSRTIIAIQKMCRRAGVTVAGSHAMRRSFGRWAVLGLGPFEGKPIPVYAVSRWLGHSSLQMTERYLALSDQASDDLMPE